MTVHAQPFKWTGESRLGLAKREMFGSELHPLIRSWDSCTMLRLFAAALSFNIRFVTQFLKWLLQRQHSSSFLFKCLLGVSFLCF